MRLASIVRRVVLPCLVLIGVATPAASPPGAQPATLAPHQRLLREIYQELIEIKTTDSVGDNTKAAEAMARRLVAAGFPAADVQVLAPAPRKGNLVARLHGSGGRRPLWLLANHRALIDAELALNEGAGGSIKNGVYLSNNIQASEKIVQGYRLEVKNPGGHSSLPVKDNAISHLAAGLVRLGEFDFPVRLDDVNRTFFERTAAIARGTLADDMRAIAGGTRDPAVVARLAGAGPVFNARLRTTCVATRLEGGHANNALPQTARAVVNCRVLPGESEDEVRRPLIRALASDKITVTPNNRFFPSPASPLTPDVMRAVESVTAAMWPGVPVIPSMSTGATDSRFLRSAGLAAYGTSGMFGDIDDVRMHGRDERLLVRSLYEGQEYLYRVTKALTSR